MTFSNYSEASAAVQTLGAQGCFVKLFPLAPLARQVTLDGLKQYIASSNPDLARRGVLNERDYFFEVHFDSSLLSWPLLI